MDQELVKKCIVYLNSVEAFIKEEAPELCSEILRYSIIDNITGIGFCFFCIIICFFSIYHGYSNPDLDKYGDRGIFSLLKMMIGSVLSIMFISISIGLISDLLKCYIAPRYYLLQKLSSLLNN